MIEMNKGNKLVEMYLKAIEGGLRVKSKTGREFRVKIA